MGEAEFRNGQYGLVLDYIHAPLKAGVSTRNILFNGATSGLTIDSGTAMFMYRRIALSPSLDIADGLSWADPLLAAGYHRDIGNGFSLTAYGDVGGFGAGAHFDWQLIGTIDYAAASWIDLHAGFRSSNFSYGAPRGNIEFNLNGPILAASFRF